MPSVLSKLLYFRPPLPHNPKVGGSNPPPVTNLQATLLARLFCCATALPKLGPLGPTMNESPTLLQLDAGIQVPDQCGNTYPLSAKRKILGGSNQRDKSLLRTLYYRGDCPALASIDVLARSDQGRVDYTVNGLPCVYEVETVAGLRLHLEFLTRLGVLMHGQNQ